METFLATLNTSMIIANDCTRFYTDSMERTIQEVSTYFSESELKEIHEKTKSKAIWKVSFGERADELNDILAVNLFENFKKMPRKTTCSILIHHSSKIKLIELKIIKHS